MGVANLVSRLNLNESQKWAGVINLFLDVGSNSCKVRGDWKFLGWAWSKIGVMSLVTEL